MRGWCVLMKNQLKRILLLFPLFCVMTGCGTIGSKSANISVIYGMIAVISLLLLVAYAALIHKKEPWFLLLFSAVFLVDMGYVSISISKTLEEALLANRISYLGSVFLPLSMVMIIMEVCKLNYKKWMPMVLLLVSCFVFLVAASPGYLNIYYEKVSLLTKNGVSFLDKTYGPWHNLYLFYLIAYFGFMVVSIIYATIKKSVESSLHAIFLAGAVLVNIGVWLLGQLIHTDFEFLSISYIITEFFMLCLSLARQEQSTKKVSNNDTEKTNEVATDDVVDSESSIEIVVAIAEDSMPKLEDGEFINESLTEQQEHFWGSIDKLTPTEKKIYDLYLQNKPTKEIMGLLSITENTLKYHNKNIYGKLGVSSRKQLVEIAKELAELGKL